LKEKAKEKERKREEEKVHTLFVSPFVFVHNIYMFDMVKTIWFHLLQFFSFIANSNGLISF